MDPLTQALGGIAVALLSAVLGGQLSRRRRQLELAERDARIAGLEADREKVLAEVAQLRASAFDQGTEALREIIQALRQDMAQERDGHRECRSEIEALRQENVEMRAEMESLRVELTGLQQHIAEGPCERCAVLEEVRRLRRNRRSRQPGE